MSMELVPSIRIIFVLLKEKMRPVKRAEQCITKTETSETSRTMYNKDNNELL